MLYESGIEGERLYNDLKAKTGNEIHNKCVMRLNPKDILFEQPILRIRAIVRDAMADRLKSIDKDHIEKRAAMLIKQSKSVAQEVLRQMIHEGYLTLEEVNYSGTIQYEISATEKGRRLGVASANAPITRKKAENLLNELIESAKKINANNELVYYIERLSVFGSYLSQKELLGDLDVFYKLSKRFEGDEFKMKSEERISEAFENGRNFNSFLDQLYWPEREVLLMIKTKRKGLSLHDEVNDEVFNRTESVTIFECKSIF